MTCPECDGKGSVFEDGVWVRCPVCHGSGRLSQHAYEQWEDDEVAVYEAQRRYVRELTAD